MQNKVTTFLGEVKSEFKKVSWPTRDELFASTTVILIGVAILAVFIGICDLVFSRMINALIR